MCGIIWIQQNNGKAALKKFRKAYHNQSNRGSDGFGYVEITGRTLGPLTRRQTEKEIFECLRDSRAPEILGHHRMPTSTINTPNTAHPIPISHKDLEYDYIGVHNGMCRNHAELRKDHLKLGYEYTSELIPCWWGGGFTYADDKQVTKYNDSESLLIDIARSIESGATKTEAKGTMAFMILQVDKTTREAVTLFFGRNEGRPLVMHDGDNHLRISSEGSGTEVAPHKLMSYDYATQTFSIVKDMLFGDKDTPKSAPTPIANYHGHNSGGRYEPFYSEVDRCWKEWDHTLYKYVRMIKQPSFGFDTTGLALPLPPAPATKTDTVEIDAEVNQEWVDWMKKDGVEPTAKTIYTAIPGLKGGTLKISTSGGTKEFMFVEDLELAYTNIGEEIEFLADDIRQAQKEKNDTLVEELNIYYNYAIDDEAKFKKHLESIQAEIENTEPIAS